MSLGVFQKKRLQAPPHPAIPTAVLLVIEDAIKVAWSKIRNLPNTEFDLVSSDEDTITQKLHEVLMDDIYGSGEVVGFSDELISKGTREEKVRSYDSSHLDKMPDLIFGIIGRNVYMRTQDGIIIECKPVGPSHTVGAHYCNKGIVRFVRGEYAWCMLTALMIGYVAKDFSIVPKLSDALSRSTNIKTKITPTVCTNSIPRPFTQDSHMTVHERDFSYIETGEAAPDIAIRHIWLNREGQA